MTSLNDLQWQLVAWAKRIEYKLGHACEGAIPHTCEHAIPPFCHRCDLERLIADMKRFDMHIYGLNTHKCDLCTQPDNQPAQPRQ